MLVPQRLACAYAIIDFFRIVKQLLYQPRDCVTKRGKGTKLQLMRSFLSGQCINYDCIRHVPAAVTGASVPLKDGVQTLDRDRGLINLSKVMGYFLGETRPLSSYN